MISGTKNKRRVGLFLQSITPKHILYLVLRCGSWIYAGIVTLWFFTGLIPAVIALVPGLRVFMQTATRDVTSSDWMAIFYASYSISPFEWQATVAQFLFSLLNLSLGIALLWLQPRNLSAHLLAIGMLGTAAVFNLPAHIAQTVIYQFSQIHSWLHIISGLAYMWALWLFPTGRFVPIRNATMPLTSVVSLLSLLGLMFGSLFFQITDGEPEGMVLIFGLIIPISGLLTQGLRYFSTHDPVERQQSRLVCLALLLALGLAPLFAAISFLPGLLQRSNLPLLWSLGTQRLVFAVFPLLFAIIPLTLFAVIIRFRLWDVELLLNRTMVYGALTLALSIVYLLCVIVIQELVWDSGFSPGLISTPAIVLSTLAIAALFNPLRRRIQRFVDRRFYREQVDFRTAFTAFAQEIRTIVSLPELLHTLVVRTTELLHSTHGAIFLHTSNGTWALAEAHQLPPDAPSVLLLNHTQIEQLTDRRVVEIAERGIELLVPLTAPRAQPASPPQLIGLLALGSRRSGQKYGVHEQTLLLSLADQAGTAITVAQLVIEQQQEIELRLGAERRLEAHRASPLGRAEQLAQELGAEPHQVLHRLYQLAQRSVAEPDAQQILDHLPRIFAATQAAALAQMAEGYSYLVASHTSPELLAVGLRSLMAGIDQHTALPRETAAELLAIYSCCRDLLEVEHVEQIAELLPADQTPQTHVSKGIATNLAQGLSAFRSVADTLRALEQVAATEDRLSYLAHALEQLRRIDASLRTASGTADSAIIRRITERWLGIVSHELRETQIRPLLTCTLETRRIWLTANIALLLHLRNSGRGVARELHVALAPAAGIHAMEQPVFASQLAPGEATQLEIALQLDHTKLDHQLRLRWLVSYRDTQGAELVEHFTDVVTLLDIPAEFSPIVNPYVVGTPLRAGSPLFVGREDLVRFIQEHLAALHSNNLVLIGQRRTGKTSLLKQLPAQLDPAFLPIYLDGQALGLDPGLPNFFLTLATEMAYALEDAGYTIGHPALTDFLTSPALSFERGFLTQVRAILGERRLVLLLDEFEELEAAVQRGTLEPTVFAVLRHLMQHTPDLRIIFCGTHRLEELASEYWSALFNIALYRHVGFLSYDDAMHLICGPVDAAGLRYDDLALQKIWRVTAGQPYFLQLLCYTIVGRQNQQRRSYVTIDDVNAALDELFSAGEAHFLFLWTESSRAERLALALLSRAVPLGGQISVSQLAKELQAQGVALERGDLDIALRRLVQRDILTASDEAGRQGTSYRWKLGVLGLWVERARPLRQVAEGVR